MGVATASKQHTLSELTEVSKPKFKRFLNELDRYAVTQSETDTLSLRLNSNLKQLVVELASKRNISISSLTKLALIREVKSHLIEQREDTPTFTEH